MFLPAHRIEFFRLFHLIAEAVLPQLILLRLFLGLVGAEAVITIFVHLQIQQLAVLFQKLGITLSLWMQGIPAADDDHRRRELFQRFLCDFRRRGQHLAVQRQLGRI